MMDVLRPPLIYIGGRCYRKNPVDNQTQWEDTKYEDDILEPRDDAFYDDEICDAFTELEETETGFRLKLSIPSAFFKYIIGKKGETKKKLENETRTQLRIPKAGQEGDIAIVGRERKGILSAKTRIEVLVDSARQRLPFTHFLSIPINSAIVMESFQVFKEDVLKQCNGDIGLDSTIFQNPAKLHLTLGTLVLSNETEVETAAALLQRCEEEVIRPMLQDCPLISDVGGLEYMNDDPGAVDVLYAQVTLQDGSDRLQMLVDRVVDAFVTGGLMTREYDRVKMHVTVMNTLMRKDPSGTSEPRRDRRGQPLGGPERESFDASRVLELFQDFNFGRHHIDTIHISKRYSTGQDGYYACAASIALPS